MDLGSPTLKCSERRFMASGLENYGEEEVQELTVIGLHLSQIFPWAGTCYVPAQGTYEPSISAISVAPADFIPTVSNNSPNEPANKKNMTGMIMGVLVSVGAVSFLPLLAMYYSVQRRKRQKIYEDEGNKSLCLDWSTRFDICLGVARGLAYLHEESRLRIVHRDVKASNILLDSQLNPKNSDFGLAKLYDDKKTHYKHSRCRHNAWHCHENKREMELVDTNLSEFNEDEARSLIGVALLCSQTSPVARPSMSDVVAMLSGDVEVPTITSEPGYLCEWNFSDISTVVVDSDSPTSRAD
ncbi:hypothetical protein Pfo_013349 [Paulownia fortunei]|nr:hypothetical protein Pfo_013349 [Paulownia fortunei]